MSSTGESLSRRGLLRVGGLSLAGLTLPQLLAGEVRAADRPAKRGKAKSCILFFLEGGPSHIDLWDMKPDAPENVRGEFKPIPTTVPGVRLCEHLPRLARQIHRFALVRSVTHSITDHNASSYYTLTGRHPANGSRLIVADSPNNFPPYGAVVSRLRPSGGPLPDFVHIPDLLFNCGSRIAGQSAGFLGAAYNPFVTGDPSGRDYRVPGLTPLDDVPPQRIDRRGALLKDLGGVSDSTAAERMDVYYRRAYDLVTSPEAQRAFDLSREPAALRERYGLPEGNGKGGPRGGGGLPQLGQCMLLARRLVEAGVRLVTVCAGRRADQAFDTHRDHFPSLRRSVPDLDRAFSALIEDLAQRGLLDETLVVAVGEFGRTPKIGEAITLAGADANGRDHWPYCYTTLFAGAGIAPGAVHGASDRLAAYPSRDPVSPEQVTATIYEALGVPADTHVRDALGQPHRLILGEPIRAILRG